MLVYHGSNTQVSEPDVNHSQKYLDFGKGFYVTIFKEQALKWAKRKALRYGGEAIVNVYEIPDEMIGERIKNFINDDEHWLDFICDCRKGKIQQEYDIVIGNVADDDVFKSVDMYFRGLWDRTKTLEEIRYYKKNNQIAFLTQEAIDDNLRFKESYGVDK